jgi:hypothetical protein
MRRPGSSQRIYAAKPDCLVLPSDQICSLRSPGGVEWTAVHLPDETRGGELMWVRMDRGEVWAKGFDFPPMILFLFFDPFPKLCSKSHRKLVGRAYPTIGNRKLALIASPDPDLTGLCTSPGSRVAIEWICLCNSLLSDPRQTPSTQASPLLLPRPSLPQCHTVPCVLGSSVFNWIALEHEWGKGGREGASIVTAAHGGVETPCCIVRTSFDPCQPSTGNRDGKGRKRKATLADAVTSAVECMRCQIVSLLLFGKTTPRNTVTQSFSCPIFICLSMSRIAACVYMLFLCTGRFYFDFRYCMVVTLI